MTMDTDTTPSAPPVDIARRLGRPPKNSPAQPDRHKRLNEHAAARKAALQYLGRTQEICTVGKWSKIVKRAVDDALGGNHAARMWLSSILLPDPRRIHETLQQADAMQVVMDNLSFSFYQPGNALADIQAGTTKPGAPVLFERGAPDPNADDGVLRDPNTLDMFADDGDAS